MSTIFKACDEKWLSRVLGQIATARVTVFGDFCLDAYWTLAPSEDEFSLETGLVVRQVQDQYHTPGGAGNVALNLLALGAAEVRAVGLVGDDLYAGELRRLLIEAGVNLDGLKTAPKPWKTPTYAKPYRNGEELNRWDFGATNDFPASSIPQLLEALGKAAASSDVVVINQQLPCSVFSPESVDGINRIIAKFPDVIFIVDSRHFAGSFEGAMMKVNAREAAALLDCARPRNAAIPLAEVCDFGARLHRKVGQPVCITRGEHGILIAESSGTTDIPGIQVLGNTDTVGAGDTVVAALAAALGGGAALEAAGQLANLAASITVQKLRTTGTASAAEILEAGPRPDYIFEPELADNPRLARYLGNSMVEVVRECPSIRLRHAVFDHDGTLSTLRQGWEKIMEPMMMSAVLGARLNAVSTDEWNQIQTRVRDFIDKTTGIQTLAQMKGLAALVREYSYVREEEILDEHGYKAIYNKSLLEMVNGRIRQIESGELSWQDFEIKGARAMLDMLHANGVCLYLASGTDEEDVKREATVMGYAHLFEGGIHGAVGDLKVEAKRAVLERIMHQNRLSGSELIVVGDGPVELREGGKRGALCLGVASDERCRFGLELSKRARLIRAGADYVIPDFSQLHRIKLLLGL